MIHTVTIIADLVACGIWMSKYKCNRPEEKWDNSQAKTTGLRKRPTQRVTKTNRSGRSRTANRNQARSNAGPQSEPNFAYHDSQSAQTDPPESADEVTEPANDREVDKACQDAEKPPPQRQARQSSEKPSKRLNAMTSNAASDALRRAIQSSPARWGSKHSPINLEDEEASTVDTTRRLLFPSPRKDNLPMALGDMVKNAAPTTDAAMSKHAGDDVPNKENCPPSTQAIEDPDPELLKLFEQELERPCTPTKPIVSNPFKTPTRLVSTHRPITRSITRSGKVAVVSGISPPPQKTPSRTPGSLSRRRSPRNQQIFESPFTASFNAMMSEAVNGSPSLTNNLHFDMSNLPDLSDFAASTHLDLDFQMSNFDDDLFSAEVRMPSSPPKLFDLYEDPQATLRSVDWANFADYTSGASLEKQDVRPGMDMQETEKASC